VSQEREQAQEQIRVLSENTRAMQEKMEAAAEQHKVKGKKTQLPNRHCGSLSQAAILELRKQKEAELTEKERDIRDLRALVEDAEAQISQLHNVTIRKLVVFMRPHSHR
jgi:DNA replication initiation complex subunit (GINS family)